MTNFNLLVYLINALLILLQTVRYDRHQVEMYFLRTVPEQIITTTTNISVYVNINIFLQLCSRSVQLVMIKVQTNALCLDLKNDSDGLSVSSRWKMQYYN